MNSCELPRNSPLPLKNVGQNISFFNSVLQGLFSLDGFREYVFKLETDSGPQLVIKTLFTSMKFSDTPIETYKFMPSIQLLHYNHQRCEQFDAEECLTHLINTIYTSTLDNNSISEDNIFRLSFRESILCQNCDISSEQNLEDHLCHIEFSNHFHKHSIENEILKLMSMIQMELLWMNYMTVISARFEQMQQKVKPFSKSQII